MPSKQHTKKQATNKKVKTTKHTAAGDVPQFFRLNLEVGNLESAISFYSRLLSLDGRKQAGSRCYFECGPVTLQVLDVSSQRQPHPAAKALYFTVNDLEAVHERAKALHCLSDGEVHSDAGGGIAVRPWGERSFYAQDPWGNHLCFVEEGTVYTGWD
jgi:predicted enzyme related to lactoylglutathione lyase